MFIPGIFGVDIGVFERNGIDATEGGPITMPGCTFSALNRFVCVFLPW